MSAVLWRRQSLIEAQSVKAKSATSSATRLQFLPSVLTCLSLSISVCLKMMPGGGGARRKVCTASGVREKDNEFVCEIRSLYRAAAEGGILDAV